MFWFVAAITRTSSVFAVFDPSFVTLCSCSTRSRLTCMSTGISPISSRNSVPPSANSNFPTAPVSRAPVNAPPS